jgi:hypothetical protein
VPGTFLEQVVGIDPVLEADHCSINRSFQDCEKEKNEMTREIELVGNFCDLFKKKKGRKKQFMKELYCLLYVAINASKKIT